MAELLQAPTEGYEDAIVILEIAANNFKLKHGLINLVQIKQFFGHDKEDPHAHIRYFNKITSTMRVPNVPSSSIKLMLFPFSLKGAAQIWLEKEPPRCILTWDDLVTKFINQLFLPSKTTNLRNEIMRFQQRFDESFYEAWDRFNDLLRMSQIVLLAVVPTSTKIVPLQEETFIETTSKTDFVVVDFEPDPRVPLILGRCFLKAGRALIDVHKGELTLRIGNEAITYNLDQTLRYSANYNQIRANKIDVICDEKNSKVCEAKTDKSFVDEPPEVELKDLPPHLKYAFLEGDNKLPITIAKELGDEEKSTLIKVLKSHKRAIAWKLSDIQGINPEFFTHKILMEEDYKPAEKSHFMVKEGIVLGHKISKNGIKVDRAKVDVIAKLPHPTTAKVLDTKGAENLAADHLSRLENPYENVLDPIEINETFPLETLSMVTFRGDSNAPWFADFENYHAGNFIVKGENRASWSNKLDNALWAFRTAYKTPIGCTPYKLVYGKACHLPIELEHKAYWALKQANFELAIAGDHRKVQLNELNELRDHAYENSLIYKEKMKIIHDSKIKNCVFNVGDRVLLFNSRLKILLGKLKTRWSGPFTIAKVFPYGTVEPSQANGPNFKVNGHRIKHYFRGDVPQLDYPDCEVFRALSFSFTRASHPQLHFKNP
nr:reverse transcriptase domain-containing protein [Tanacetum cinerariifolium]